MREKNNLITKQNQAIEQIIAERRKEHQTLFQNTLEVITKRVEASQKDKASEEMQKQIMVEKDQIEKLNGQIDSVEALIKDKQNEYKEKVRLELGELNEMKNQEIARIHDIQQKTRDLIVKNEV